MNRKKFALVVLTVLLISAVAAAQDQLPINPAPGYYGSVTVNGQPAPQGTIITAKIGAEVRGSITTSASGFYGDNPGPSKLWLTGFQNEIGSQVTFYVSDIAAQQTAQLTEAGTTNRIDLTFIIPSGGPGGDGGDAGTVGDSGTTTGGGGGGGVISAEPFENIEFYEIREADLVAGIPVTFRFTNPQLAMYELVITANVSAGLTSARNEQLKSTSRLVTSPPEGSIYKNLNIWLGPPGFAVPKNIREGIVRFRINNSWLSGENIDAGSISMMKWDGSQWISLGTKKMGTDDKFEYYEARTNSFSPFAIIGEKSVPITGVTPAAGVSPTAAPLAVMPPATLNWILYAGVAIVIIAVVYYYATRKKDKKEQ